MKTFYITVVIVTLFYQTILIKAESTETARSDLDEDESRITKRSGSGSGDFLSHLKYNIAGTLGKTSASLSSGSSSHSAPKGGSHGYKGNHIDAWNFKSSFFGTIKQAVKAITGGVTAIKGQLIKGSGFVLSASGKVVSASGDKITEVGKNAVNSAQFQLAHPNYGENVHPFHKISSLSGSSSSASSGSSSGKDSGSIPSKPVVHHTETITTYEIPADHVHSGPPNHPVHYGHISHHNRPSDAYVGNLPPHILAAHENPYEYHRHTYEDAGGVETYILFPPYLGEKYSKYINSDNNYYYN